MKPESEDQEREALVDEVTDEKEAPLSPEELAAEVRALRTDRDRLRATVARREALLRVAARSLRRYNVGDRIAASIDTELGDGILD